MNSGVDCNIYKDDLCFCGRPLVMEADDTVVLIESGQMRETIRDPNFVHFHPDWKAPNDQWTDPDNIESVIIKAVHFDCFVEEFNQRDINWLVNPNPNKCHVANCDFDFRRGGRWAYRLTVGNIDDNCFVPDTELPNKGVIGVVCVSCMMRFATGTIDKPILSSKQSRQTLLF